MIDTLEPQSSMQARNRLHESPITELRDLEIVEDGECLCISGRVRSFYHKQLAQETVRQTAPGWTVVNRVAVD
ncbi:hypothetical protein Poly24_06250 [Rosistilla carotiformis]|uniref:BON domain-containing protein n=1 Tax=Rosistilla carotiformis TaxID=2528017 RepID=A0A518JN05_9BACT|nr:BON domain-containing protein [Rosistilla carotiformis]QDV66936.1 hypothetical protein Poly24_06250 [Rosistilla carotiformis]